MWGFMWHALPPCQSCQPGWNFGNLIRAGFLCGKVYPLWYGVFAIGIAPLAGGLFLNIVILADVTITAELALRRNYFGHPGQIPALKS